MNRDMAGPFSVRMISWQPQHCVPEDQSQVWQLLMLVQYVQPMKAMDYG